MRYDREYMSQWIKADPAVEKMRKIWAEYYMATESYDASVCMCKNEYGIAIPTDPRERWACTRYARFRLDLVKEGFARAGLEYQGEGSRAARRWAMMQSQGSKGWES